MSEPRLAGFALDTALLVTLATALLFVAGWGYAEQWFGLFDLGVVGLGIPSGNFAIYGYWSLESRVWWLVGLAMVAAAAPLVSLVVRRRFRLAAPPWRWLGTETRAALGRGARNLAPVLLFALFWGAYALGQQAARESFAAHQAKRFCAFPHVWVVPKENASWPKALDWLREPLAAGQYRLLIQSGGVLALFRVNPKGEERLPPLPGLVVPVGEISLFELDPVPQGCRRN